MNSNFESGNDQNNYLCVFTLLKYFSQFEWISTTFHILKVIRKRSKEMHHLNPTITGKKDVKLSTECYIFISAITFEEILWDNKAPRNIQFIALKWKISCPRQDWDPKRCEICRGRTFKSPVSSMHWSSVQRKLRPRRTLMRAINEVWW